MKRSPKVTLQPNLIFPSNLIYQSNSPAEIFSKDVFPAQSSVWGKCMRGETSDFWIKRLMGKRLVTLIILIGKIAANKFNMQNMIYNNVNATTIDLIGHFHPTIPQEIVYEHLFIASETFDGVNHLPHHFPPVHIPHRIPTFYSIRVAKYEL